MSKFTVCDSLAIAANTKESTDKIIQITSGSDSGKFAIVSNEFVTDRSYFHSPEGQKVFFDTVSFKLYCDL